MNHPQETDPCVFIRKDIEITQKLIDDGRFELQHPEILTHDVVVRLKEDLERRGKLLDSFKDALHRCRAENPHSKSSQTGPIGDRMGWLTATIDACNASGHGRGVGGGRDLSV